VLVVNPGNTHREAALRARRHLDTLGAKVLGFVFNAASVDGRLGYYGYYAYGEEPEPAKGKSAVKA
jgi:Mrp family chromosome partitioning ATPase